MLTIEVCCMYCSQAISAFKSRRAIANQKSVDERALEMGTGTTYFHRLTIILCFPPLTNRHSAVRANQAFSDEHVRDVGENSANS